MILKQKKPVSLKQYRNGGVQGAIRNLLEQAYAACKTLETSDSLPDRRMMAQTLRFAIERAQQSTQINLEILR